MTKKVRFLVPVDPKDLSSTAQSLFDAIQAQRENAPQPTENAGEGATADKTSEPSTVPPQNPPASEQDKLEPDFGLIIAHGDTARALGGSDAYFWSQILDGEDANLIAVDRRAKKSSDAQPKPDEPEEHPGESSR